MSGAYEKINNWNSRSIRKLNDYHLLIAGRKAECTRLALKKDVWGNTDIEPISTSQIQAIFVFPPGEMPLIRLRDGKGTQAQVQSSTLYFYDILPCEIYVRWQDQIENGDILFFFVLDENGNKMPIVFKILDQKGAVSSQLIWRKLIAAPVTSLEPTEVPSDLKERLLAMIN